ncbi:MAG: hypothetical protein A4E66_00151 [Syntrophus sp. PtaB.Bin001]|nr:MAG: hypothetical protein A4E66_00151 [Syntrophus sp. PtaB.Bin001]
MAGITLEQAEAQLAVWIAANTAVSSNQSYTIGNRSLTRTNSSEILKNIEFWDAKVKELSSSPSGKRYMASVIPV